MHHFFAKKAWYFLPYPIVFKNPYCLLDGLKSKYGQEGEVRFFSEEAASGLDDFESYLLNGPMKKPDYILDVGCGAGREAIAFAKLGYKVKAIDISPRMIDVAKEIAKKEGLLIEFEEKCATEIDYDNEFDYCLFSSGVYNSIPTKELRIEVIKKVMRALKPKGMLFLSIGIARKGRILSRDRFINMIRKILEFFLKNKFKTEPGDTLISQVSPYSNSKIKVFHHFFFSFKQIETELCLSGFKVRMLKPGLWELTRPHL